MPAKRYAVGACIGAGLVGGEGFAVDASLIVADANKQRSTPGSQWNRELDAQAVSRATKDYLATLDDTKVTSMSRIALVLKLPAEGDFDSALDRRLGP